MKTRILLLFFVLLMPLALKAQNADNKWGGALYFGVMEYAGDVAQEFYSFKQGYGVGADLARYLNPSFDLLLHFFYDKPRANDGGSLGAPTWISFNTHIYNLNLLAKYKFANGYILKEDALLAPYLLGGIGGGYFSANGTGENGPYQDETFIRPNLYGGLGLNVRVHPAISFGIQTSLVAPFTDEADGVTGDVVAAPNNSNDLFLQNSLNLRVTPGAFKKKDSDGDGVPDKKDKCPDTPQGVAVDEDGCPLDNDGDGVPDYQDECPDVPGLAKYNGCPDTDGDGIIDKNDECPDVAGIALLKGCPDSDGDGVADKDDRCPDTPKGWKVDRFGCPLDADRDGIPDSEDACPDTPGIAELKGCPIDVAYLMSKYNLYNRQILFDFDKSELRPAGIETLDQIYQALSNHEGFGVEFFGHTDYIGTEKYNMGLSERRALVAKDYLINKGVTGSRIRTTFFGETKPTADNKTKEGRQLNRRTEFELFQIK